MVQKAEKSPRFDKANASINYSLSMNNKAAKCIRKN
jgi:hypothetical protein